MPASAPTIRASPTPRSDSEGSGHLASSDFTAPDPLRDFNDSERAIIEERLRILSTLAYHVGKDFEVTVLPNEPGGGWHWNFAINEVRADAREILERPFDYSRFVICHEGAHVRITRVGAAARELWKVNGFSFLMNVIEDPRVNNYVVHAYPYLRDKMTLVYSESVDLEKAAALTQASKRTGFKPLCIEAGLEYIKAWLRERNGEGLSAGPDLNPKVKKLIEETLAPASAAWNRYPSKAEADRGEDVIKLYANASQKFIYQDIWPKFKELVDIDLRKLSLGIATQGKGGGISKQLSGSLTPEETKELEEALKEHTSDKGNTDRKPIDVEKLSKELQDKIREYLDRLPKEERDEIEEEANSILAGALDEVNEKVTGKSPTDSGNPGPRTGENDTASDGGLGKYRDRINLILQRDLDAYTIEARREGSSIVRLVQAIETELAKRIEESYDVGFRSGQRLSLRHRISEIASNKSSFETSAWERLVDPQAWSYAFSFLIDLSPSMRGQRIQEAFRACVVISEALRRARIPFEIVGFNNGFHEFKAFSDQISREARSKIGGMIKSTGGSTDLGFGILEASSRLANSKAKDQILVCLTDGRPEPSSRHSGPEFSMPYVVRTVIGDRKQRLIGVGLNVDLEVMLGNFPGCTHFLASDAGSLFRVFPRIVESEILKRGTSDE